ncbi:DUF4238 domain-containing protein [Legionella drozanskii]|uniref:DUF4238 domain-containing protein n=1 Tax=Legionella drozanskii LLAP-1 TaxID=1212489 RepID=A0A0W0T0X4_9GAMM|nr:DUF4238 domain-containing protein [Legionella drozanskii]KTC89117.1 hypothetical protein Ldro_0775 [Legionella drozanskii LLAP-1]
MKQYQNHHYVSQWYQYNFIPSEFKSKNLYYLDLNPPQRISAGHRYSLKNPNWWGPSKCFFSKHLYSLKIGEGYSTELEEKFFGRIDRIGAASLNYFSNFTHPSANSTYFDDFIDFMSTQRLRTPKGLGYFQKLIKISDQNELLKKIEELQRLFGAIWSESQWCILDASQSNIKFIISDHPVTTYNKQCFPGSKYCLSFNDPDIRFLGTHTIFPLNFNKLLVLTNNGWFRNPYQKPLKYRENPHYVRNSFFNFQDIQIGRQLSELEVSQINYIIKNRAFRYIAAAKEEWLYPESKLSNTYWPNFGKDFLLMPDPRSSLISSGPLISYFDGRIDAYDIYGRKPHDQRYEDQKLKKKESEAFKAFRGDYARKFGPRRRGLTGVGAELGYTDDPESHTRNIKIPKLQN